MSHSLLLFTLLCALLSLSLATNDDQKTYYGHHQGHGHHSSPSTPSTPTPSHGSSGEGTPSSTPTPSHGSSGKGTPSTPKNCPTPSTPSKSPPSSGHGGTTHPSPTPTPYVPTPSVPTPSVPTPYVPTPSVPTPSVPTPSVPTPFIPDPNTPPFTCTYWKNHPQLIWGVLGWFGTVGNAFGVPNVPGMGSSTSLKDVLTNTRTDAYSELCRQATAALLNSMVDHHFSLSANQVRDSFVAALPSDKTAAIQANLFRLANEAKH